MPKNVVADRELLHGRADCHDLARELAAGNAVLRPPEAFEEAPEKRLGPAPVAVGPVHRPCVHTDQNLVVSGGGALDLLDPEHVGRPVPVLDDGPHRSARWIRWIGPPRLQASPGR